jgi:hypothetical protein
MIIVIILSLTDPAVSLRILQALLRSKDLQVCYTEKMQTEIPGALRPTWLPWVEFLRKRKLETMAAWAIDALGPLAVLAAQVVHAGSPFFQHALSSSQVDSIAHLLEDPMETRAFAAYLREDATCGQ